jgi:disulfide bond formation protein DsbB
MPLMRLSPRAILGGCALIGAAALAAAVISQHAFGFEPCSWCILQRLILLLLILVCAAGAIAGTRERPRRWPALLALPIALCGLGSALWQHFVAARSSDCKLTLADRVVGGLHLGDAWPWMFEATARCDEANLPMLGLPYALWSAALFVLIAFGSALAARYRSNHMFLQS